MPAKFAWIVLFLAWMCSHLVNAQPAFSEIAESAGVYFDHVGSPYGGGIALGDFNADGLEDLYVSNGKGHPNALFLNNGDETFTEVAQSAGVADTSEGMGVVCGDVDNDGDLDIFLSNHWSENKLYLNDGNARFSDATKAAGLDAAGPGTSVAMADYDLDGWLDIYLLNHAQDNLDYANTLYHNKGDGTFSDVTEESGAGGASTSLAAGFFDFNNDMYPDIYVVNEYDRDELFINNRDDTFSNMREEIKIPSGGGMGLDFADYDEDGDIDVYVSNLYRDFLLRNDDGITLTDVTEEAGIENLTMGWGVSFFDYDNDGDRDIHVVNGAMIWPRFYDETNVFFRNNGYAFFTQAAPQLDLDTEGDSRASACADFNNDGYIDIAVLNIDRDNLQLFKNNGEGNNWITVKLIGTKSNYNGIGARVEVKSASKTQIKEIRAGSSYASNHSLSAAFGLKKADKVDYLTVHWPSGEIQELPDVEVNQILTITEPGSRETPANSASAFTLYQNYPNPFNPGTEIHFQLPKTSRVVIKIYNTLGQEILTLGDASYEAGLHQLRWDGKERHGSPAASGVYLYRMKAGEFTAVRKMLLLR